MTAGVRYIPQAPHCGCCDRAEAVAVCERCQEPTCIEHFARVRTGEGTVSYVCTICAEVLRHEALQPAAPAVGVA